MTLALYAHPLSSYCWKVLIALYENDTAFELRELGPDFPEHGAEFARRWPLAKMPLLLDGEQAVAETSVIVEHLDLRHPGAVRFVPAGEAGLRVRFLDRFFDNYVMTPMQKFVDDRLRAEADRDPFGVAEARALLDRSRAWAEGAIGTGWAAGDAFTLADCAAAPSLFYADQVHPMAGRFPRLAGYLDRLRARPGVARVLAEKDPYWAMFPFAGDAAS